MPSSSKQRAQGGGRKANSEPRLQVFKEFGGCNFELAPHEPALVRWAGEQSDLQMNYMAVQNNAGITSNNTIETRNNVVKLFNPPNNRKFTDACILVGDEFYVGLDDGSIAYYKLGWGMALNGYVSLTDNSASHPGHHWESFAYADGKLIGLTRENQLWTGDIGTHAMSNANRVPDPSAMTMSELVPNGDLSVRQYADSTHPYRISVAYTLVNKYGPTACSPEFVFYANYPVDEWNDSRYLTLMPSYGSTMRPDILAAEFYYSTGNSGTLLFAGRTDMFSNTVSQSSGVTTWSYGFLFDWFGYLDSTYMWPMANLIAPTENYTEGPKASYVTCIDSRLYFWGDSDNPQRLYIGGNSGNLFSISPGTGGGFVDVEPGTGQEIRVVTKYKTQSGASIVTMLCDSENTKREQRFNLVENNVALSNEQSMKSWQAEQVSGAIGCKSPHGAIVCEDGLYAVSRYGLALTTMAMEYNSQIRVNYVSDAIKPAFTDSKRAHLRNSSIEECDGIIYLAFGEDNTDFIGDGVLFCYDVDLKAWWTVTPGLSKPIICLLHIDHEDNREGIGIVCENGVWLLPTTEDDSQSLAADYNTHIISGELSTQQPQQSWFYLSQMEFRFDYFIGDIIIWISCIDQFGRDIVIDKHISYDELQYGLVEHMRVDLRVQSYSIEIRGQARFRMTHFISKLYAMSAKQGLVWGFDEVKSWSGRGFGSIHPTFLDYNDIKQAIIP